MRVKSVCDRLSLDLKRAVYRAEIRKYDEVIGIEREGENNYRTISDKQYAKLQKALLMADLAYSTAVIIEVLKGNKDVRCGAVLDVGVKLKKLKTLKEIL